jgi:hypothetical protein
MQVLFIIYLVTLTHKNKKMALIPQNGQNVQVPIAPYQTASVGYIWVVFNMNTPDYASVSLELWNSKEDKLTTSIYGGLQPISILNIGNVQAQFNTPDLGNLVNTFAVDFLQTSFNLTFVVTDLN